MPKQPKPTEVATPTITPAPRYETVVHYAMPTVRQIGGDRDSYFHFESKGEAQKLTALLNDNAAEIDRLRTLVAALQNSDAAMLKIEQVAAGVEVTD